MRLSVRQQKGSIAVLQMNHPERALCDRFVVKLDRGQFVPPIFTT
jgi:hypothetical protein